jgi:hypothetical protein
VKGKLDILPENLMKKGVRILNRDVAVFVFFLFLSFLFWYFNSLGKEIETDIRYPVKFINLPKQKVITEESSVRLDLYLKGPGYSILKLKISSNKTPVVIDISKVTYKRVPGSKTPDYFIITSALSKSLSVQLRSECEVTSIKPDTLFFTFEELTLKSDKLKADNKGISSR